MGAEEKTEEATPRRKQKEKEKGHIAKSQDMNAALVLLAAVCLFMGFSKSILEKLRNMLYYAFTHLNPANISSDNLLSIFEPFAMLLVKVLFPFCSALFLLAVVLVRSQVGNLFTLEAIKPKLNKISPMNFVNNAKEKLNPLKPRNLVELIKSIIKMAIVFACGYSVVAARKDELYGLLLANTETALVTISSILSQMVINICIALLIIGFLDKKYQTYEYDKSIKMTKQEIKDEFKNIEGDPIIKSKIKAAQMKFAQQKMMGNVPTADVVVTNPTHFAVAIKYDKNIAPAPIVVAKGVDFLAFKIREIAENNNIPIVENRPLARTLYKLVAVDAMIPADLYVAVAEVLAWVYNKNKGGGK